MFILVSLLALQLDQSIAWSSAESYDGSRSRRMPQRTFTPCPIGTPGQPWGAAERETWRSQQTKQRDYLVEVVSSLMRISGELQLEVFQYGQLDYHEFGAAACPLFGVKNEFRPDRPMALITSGVHGYETSASMARCASSPTSSATTSTS